MLNATTGSSSLGVTYNTNVIAIGRSLQTNSAGLSYFPNVNYQIGMDVFIASDYAKPKFVNSILTNYDYEVLLHELGHALVAKHHGLRVSSMGVALLVLAFAPSEQYSVGVQPAAPGICRAPFQRPHPGHTGGNFKECRT